MDTLARDSTLPLTAYRAHVTKLVDITMTGPLEVIKQMFKNGICPTRAQLSEIIPEFEAWGRTAVSPAIGRESVQQANQPCRNGLIL